MFDLGDLFYSGKFVTYKEEDWALVRSTSITVKGDTVFSVIKAEDTFPCPVYLIPVTSEMLAAAHDYLPKEKTDEG